MCLRTWCSSCAFLSALPPARGEALESRQKRSENDFPRFQDHRATLSDSPESYFRFRGRGPGGLLPESCVAARPQREPSRWGSGPVSRELGPEPPRRNCGGETLPPGPCSSGSRGAQFSAGAHCGRSSALLPQPRPKAGWVA